MKRVAGRLRGRHNHIGRYPARPILELSQLLQDGGGVHQAAASSALMNPRAMESSRQYWYRRSASTSQNSGLS